MHLKKDTNWYLKWVATCVLILGTAVNSAGFYPQGPIILALGGVFWLVVSIRWKEMSLIITNAVMLFTGIAGLVWNYLAQG